MRIVVRAKPNAKEDKVVPPAPEQAGLWQTEVERYYRVSTKAPPKEGKANAAITKLLAEHFHTAPSNVRLISGATSRHKIFEILN